MWKRGERLRPRNVPELGLVAWIAERKLVDRCDVRACACNIIWICPSSP